MIPARVGSYRSLGYALGSYFGVPMTQHEKQVWLGEVYRHHLGPFCAESSQVTLLEGLPFAGALTVGPRLKEVFDRVLSARLQDIVERRVTILDVRADWNKEQLTLDMLDNGDILTITALNDPSTELGKAVQFVRTVVGAEVHLLREDRFTGVQLKLIFDQLRLS